MDLAERPETPDTSQPIPGRTRAFLVGVPLLLLTVLILGSYAATLRAGFVFDDLDVITDNEAFLKGESVAQYAAKYRFRQETMRSYKRDLRLSGGETPDPKIFHAASVLSHVGVVWLLYGAFWLLAIRAGYSFEERCTFSALGAGLFALHPIQTEAVAYVSGRSDVLASFYLLIALGCFLIPTLWRPVRSASDEPGRISAGEGSPEIAPTLYWMVLFLAWGGCLALFVKALFCKETAAVLPALGLAVLWFVPGKGNPWQPRVIYLLALLFAGVALLLALRVAAFSTPNPDLDRPFFVTLATNLWALVRYVVIYFLPFGLSADHDFPLVTAIWNPQALSGLILLALLIAGVRYSRNRAPEMALGIVWFLVCLTPTTSVVPIADAFVERRLYLPSMGLCAVLAALAVRGGRRLRAQGHWDWLRWGRWAVGGTAAILMTLTIFRTHVWGNELTLWSDTFGKSPEKTRVAYNLGTALLRANHPREAATVLSRLFQKDIYDTRVHLNVAAALLKAGWFDYAERIYKNNVLFLDPDNAEARYNLAVIAERKGDTYEAKKYLEEAVRLKPGMTEALLKLGTYAFGRNEARVALDYFEKAARSDPDNATAHRYLALLFSSDLADPKRAREELEALVRIEPKEAQHWFNLGVLAEQENQLDEAKEDYRRALDQDPDHVGSLANLGAIFARMGALVESCRMYQKAAERDPAWATQAQKVCGQASSP